MASASWKDEAEQAALEARMSGIKNGHIKDTQRKIGRVARPVIGIARISREDEYGKSLENQRSAIMDWAKEHCHKHIDTLCDRNKSGMKSIFNRPQSKQAMRLAEQYVKDADSPNPIIVATRLDRLGRNAVDILKFMDWAAKHDIDVVATQDNFDSTTENGKIQLFAMLMVNQIEVENTRRRRKNANREPEKVGAWTCPQTGYGFRTKDFEGFRFLVWDDIEWRKIKIIERVLEEAGYDEKGGRRWKAASEALIELGVRPPSGRKYYSHLLRRFWDGHERRCHRVEQLWLNKHPAYRGIVPPYDVAAKAAKEKAPDDKASEAGEREGDGD